jgi:NDP-sugar pyrophosphorylase family protein
MRTVRIAAILSLSESDDHQGAADSTAALRQQPPRRVSDISSSSSYAQLDVLGQSLLDREISKLKRFGVPRHTVISEESSIPFLPSRNSTSGNSVETWERAVANHIAEGVDHLLLLQISAYTDLDYFEFLQFHLETGGSITHAYAADGALDVALVDASQFSGAGDGYHRALCALTSQQRRYAYRGYVNRLTRPQDFYQLVDDGLRKRCGLRPQGTETRPWVWQGADAEIDSSVVVTGPAFIGARSRIAACCTVEAGSSIERDCEVDCGTVIEESWVMQQTYLGMALDVRRSIVGQDALFNLDQNVEVKIGDRHLIGVAGKSVPWLAGFGSFFWGEERVSA